ncbi:endonuclease VII domain-containing protein [Actinoallomurus sp. CA-142502]|uniref:endonuclease VII domain-containing protein n=1 Tax=Actinoallomurus sp. CA-142502 TaxID=3239885 RepID=UPI003D8F57CC
MDICYFNGCNRQVSARELCSGHYQQWSAGKRLVPLRRSKSHARRCGFPDCERDHYGNGYCQFHYRQDYEGRMLTPAPTRRVRPIQPDQRYGDTGLRLCSRCNVFLSIDSFGINRATPDGRHYACRECQTLLRFNINRLQYETMWRKQGGKCKICGNVCPAHGDRLAVDHDHACCQEDRSCGRCIRGLLCMPCNTAIGMLKDDPFQILRAAEYLLESKTIPAGKVRRKMKAPLVMKLLRDASGA